MNIKKQNCFACNSDRVIVCDDDTLGFEYDLYRKCLACGELEDIGISEVI